jgi:hypothetical protein
MIDIPVDILNEIYQDVADALINDINATPVTLYFEPIELTTTAGGSEGNTLNSLLGGRTSINYVPGLGEASMPSGSSYAAMATTGTLTVRAYWNDKTFEKALMVDNVGKPKEICKIISYTTDLQLLLNANYVLVDNKRCKRISDGTPHGLFGDKRYSTTFWESF